MGIEEREFWEMTPAQFALRVDAQERERARELCVIANAHGAKAKLEDFLPPKKSVGMGPEVFRAFEKSFQEG